MTLRQYLTMDFVVNNTKLSEDQVTDQLLDAAETFIDNLIGNFYQGINRRAFLGSSIINCSLTTGKITLLSKNYLQDTFSYTVAQVLDTAVAGEYSCSASSQNGVNHEVVTNGLILSGSLSAQVRFYQLGKLPRLMDTTVLTGTRYIKMIPRDLVRAIALQAEYMELNKGLFNKPNFKSESISSSYSYSAAGKAEFSLRNQINPQTYAILDNLGLLEVYIN